MIIKTKLMFSWFQGKVETKDVIINIPRFVAAEEAHYVSIDFNGSEFMITYSDENENVVLDESIAIDSPELLPIKVKNYPVLKTYEDIYLIQGSYEIGGTLIKE